MMTITRLFPNSSYESFGERTPGSLCTHTPMYSKFVMMLYQCWVCVLRTITLVFQLPCFMQEEEYEYPPPTPTPPTPTAELLIYSAVGPRTSPSA